MSIVPPTPRDPSNPGAHDCACNCHTENGVMHVVPCCHPCAECGYDTRGGTCSRCDKKDLESSPCGYCRHPDCTDCYPTQAAQMQRVRISGGPDGSSIKIRGGDGKLFPPIVTSATVRLHADKLTMVDLTLLSDDIEIEAALSDETVTAILALADRLRANRNAV